MEVARDAQAREDALNGVLRELRRRHLGAWTSYCQRFADIEFCFFAPGELRRGRKLLRFIDERPAGPPAWTRDAMPFSVSAPPPGLA